MADTERKVNLGRSVSEDITKNIIKVHCDIWTQVARVGSNIKTNTKKIHNYNAVYLAQNRL
jgi:hypothetical protein